MVAYVDNTGETIVVPEGYDHAVYVDSNGGVTHETVVPGQTLTFKSDIIFGSTKSYLCSVKVGCLEIAFIEGEGSFGYETMEECEKHCCLRSDGWYQDGRDKGCDPQCNSQKSICETAFCAHPHQEFEGDTRPAFPDMNGNRDYYCANCMDKLKDSDGNPLPPESIQLIDTCVCNPATSDTCACRDFELGNGSNCLGAWCDGCQCTEGSLYDFSSFLQPRPTEEFKIGLGCAGQISMLSGPTLSCDTCDECEKCVGMSCKQYIWSGCKCAYYYSSSFNCGLATWSSPIFEGATLFKTEPKFTRWGLVFTFPSPYDQWVNSDPTSIQVPGHKEEVFVHSRYIATGPANPSGDCPQIQAPQAPQETPVCSKESSSSSPSSNASSSSSENQSSSSNSSSVPNCTSNSDCIYDWTCPSLSNYSSKENCEAVCPEECQPRYVNCCDGTCQEPPCTISTPFL